MKLVFLLEERSVREMLFGLLPRLLPDHVHFHCFVFEGKRDLERNIVPKLRGWRVPNTAFVILRDQDAADCKAVKRTLLTKCREAGKEDAVVRIACRELESWYFGDLAAVEQGLGLKNLARYARKQKYRVPDEIKAPARALAIITCNAYQKIAGSRAIGPNLSLTSNKSKSFQVFLRTMRRFADSAG